MTREKLENLFYEFGVDVDDCFPGTKMKIGDAIEVIYRADPDGILFIEALAECEDAEELTALVYALASRIAQEYEDGNFLPLIATEEE